MTNPRILNSSDISSLLKHFEDDKIKLYSVDDKTIFNMSDGQNGKCIVYLINVEGTKYRSFGIEFSLFFDTKDMIIAKLLEGKRIFKESIREGTAREFDPNGGDLGVAQLS